MTLERLLYLGVMCVACFGFYLYGIYRAGCPS